MKVLVVEDDLDTRAGARRRSSRSSVSTCRSASTLAEARARSRPSIPDVCLTDLQLPDGDGIDFLRRRGPRTRGARSSS